MFLMMLLLLFTDIFLYSIQREIMLIPDLDVQGEDPENNDLER